MKKRADGRYQISVFLGRDKDGKKTEKVLYGKTQKEVKEKERLFRQKHSLHSAFDSNILLSEWSDIWLNTYKTGVAYNTKKMYERAANTISESIGHLRVTEVKTAHLQAIINSYIKDNKFRTAKIIKITVNQIFKQAILNDIAYTDPTLGLTIPQNNTKKEKNILSKEEPEKILSYDYTPREKAYIYLLYYTGMRKGEILALTKNDIDLVNNKISVNKSVYFANNRPHIKTPKTKAGIRTIPILKPLQHELKEYLKNLETDYLFTNKDKNLISDIGFKKMWRNIRKKGVNYTSHEFRHNFATILYNAGVDLKTAQYILGHSNVSVTLDIYTHLSNQNHESAEQKLNNFLTRID